MYHINTRGTAHIRTYVRTYVHVRMHLYVRMDMYTHTHVCTYLYMYVYTLYSETSLIQHSLGLQETYQIMRLSDYRVTLTIL